MAWPHGITLLPGHDGNGSTTEPGANTDDSFPYLMSRDNESFVIAGEVETGTTAATHTDARPATNSASEDLLVSGTEVATTPIPKKKIPCKRPKVPKPPGANLVSSSRANSHIAERSVMGELQLSEIKDSGKVNYHSGAFGVAGNLGLLSLSLLLATLLH